MLRLGGISRYVGTLFFLIFVGRIWFNYYLSLALLPLNIFQIVFIPI